MTGQVALAQFEPQKGALTENISRIGEFVQQASKEGADLVIFPESATTGYILEGGVDELCQSPKELVSILKPHLSGLNKPIDIAIGFYEKTTSRPFNSSIYLSAENGEIEIKHVYRKFFLPTYGVFDEARFHQEGSELGIVETKFGRVGILICEDVWHSILGSLLAVAGCEMIIVHSASPARQFHTEKPGNLIRYERMLQALAEEHGVYVAMSMLVGFEGGKGLVGGSQLISPFGEMLVQANTFGEQLVIGEYNRDSVRHARDLTPLHSDLCERWNDILRLGEQFK